MTIPDYEGMVEAFYSRHLTAGDCCVDVGAHIGRHTLPMARKVGPRGKVVAFEPLTVARERLLATIAQQRDREPLPEIIVHECAVGDRADRVTFIAVEEFPEYSGLQERTYDHPVQRRQVEVDLKPLDDYFDEIGAVRYIKVDVEGAELLVLRGAQKIVDNLRPLISVEWGDNALLNYPYNAAEMGRHILGMNYRILAITGEELDLPSFIEASARQSYWDYLLIPDEQWEDRRWP